MIEPGAVAEETAGGAGPGVAGNGDTGADSRTDDEIIGAALADEGAAVSEHDTEGRGAAAGAEADEADGAAAARLDQDEVVSAVPAELKELLSNPKFAPHIQRAFNQLADFTKLGTVRDVRTLFEEFPGGVKEAIEYKNRALDVADWDSQFESGNPQQQADLAQSWFEHAKAQGRPEVYRSQIQEGLKVLRQNDPEGYKALTGGTVEETFGGDMIATDGRTWNLAAQSQAILEAIRTEDLDTLKGLSYFLIRELGAQGLGKKKAQGGRLPREQEQFKQREEDLAKREQATQETEVRIFNNTVNASAGPQLDRSLAQSVNKMLENTAFTADGKAAIVKAVRKEIEERLKADRSYQNRIKELARAAKFDASKSGDIVKFILGRAKALTVPVAKQVINGETAKFVAQRKKENERKDGAGQRVDITGGQSARNSRTGRVSGAQAQGMSDADADALLASMGA